MAINLESINRNLYFEFYLSDYLLYWYRYNTEELDLSIKELCYYLTRYVYNYYGYKKFTGFNFNFQHVLSFQLIIQFKNKAIELEQSEDASSYFPLDLKLNESDFCNNLYLNILWLSAELIKRESYTNEMDSFKALFVSKSKNVFWRTFPSYSNNLIDNLNLIVEKCQKVVISVKMRRESKQMSLERQIKYFIVQSEILQNHSLIVLEFYDKIMKHYSHFVRLHRLAHHFGKVEYKGEFNNHRLRTNLNYFLGNFKMLTDSELDECNKYMAYSLFIPNINNAIRYKDYISTQMDYMITEKNRTIIKLNDLQQQVVELLHS